mmetsp:Transcript_13800/g.41167  ORF Transcript_13800/g.41167 Transcript_13800/m.41167 type:complete len:211 (+) Transcript_13800:819-1451(+)
MKACSTSSASASGCAAARPGRSGQCWLRTSSIQKAESRSVVQRCAALRTSAQTTESSPRKKSEAPASSGSIAAVAPAQSPRPASSRAASSASRGTDQMRCSCQPRSQTCIVGLALGFTSPVVWLKSIQPGSRACHIGGSASSIPSSSRRPGRWLMAFHLPQTGHVSTICMRRDCDTQRSHDDQPRITKEQVPLPPSRSKTAAIAAWAASV